MFDVSYQTMLELVEGMREFVKENPVESNLREMGRACIETYAIRPLEDRDDHSLYLEAIYWYQRKAEMGYRDAFCKLGEMYLDGKGISKDYQKAREMFEKAILDDEHFGDGYSGYLRDRAKAYLGVIYRDGLGVESNQIKAKTFLADSADKNDAKGMYELAILFEKEGNSEVASKLFNELKNGWGQNDENDYYKNKAKEHKTIN